MESDHLELTTASATIGSSSAAFRAGYTPKKMPTHVATSSPAKMLHTAQAGRKAKMQRDDLRHADADEHADAPRQSAPSSPTPSGTAAGCRRAVAPSALRTPISRVRSVTLTSMMFMMTMPPTTSEIAAIATATASKPAESGFHSPTSVSLVSSVKLSLRRAGRAAGRASARAPRRWRSPSLRAPLPALA